MNEDKQWGNVRPNVRNHQARHPMSAITEAVLIHTDGACKGNPGPGGWGVVISRGERTTELAGGEFYTTNNRMELTAAIKGLEALKRPLPVRLTTDSQYVVNGMTKYLPDWKTRGWRKSDGKPVLNADLWQRLDELASVHDVAWVWVRGHNGDPDNVRADQLANEGIRKGCQA